MPSVCVFVLYIVEYMHVYQREFPQSPMRCIVLCSLCCYPVHMCTCAAGVKHCLVSVCLCLSWQIILKNALSRVAKAFKDSILNEKQSAVSHCNISVPDIS